MCCAWEILLESSNLAAIFVGYGNFCNTYVVVLANVNLLVILSLLEILDMQIPR
jgi:hypothetical protein